MIIYPASVIGEVADGAQAKLYNCCSTVLKAPIAGGKERASVGAVADENGNDIDGMFFASDMTVADGFSLVKNPEENYCYVVANVVSGSGTEADPYLIGSALELRWFANYVNTSTGRYLRILRRARSRYACGRRY